MKNGLELSKGKHGINTRKSFLQPTSHRAAAVPLKGSRESPALYVKHYSKKYLSVMEKIKPAQTGMVSKLSQLHVDKFLALISTLKPGPMLSYAPTSSRFHQHRVVHFFPTIHVQVHIHTQLKLLLSWKKYLWIHSGFFNSCQDSGFLAKPLLRCYYRLCLLILVQARNEPVILSSKFQVARLLLFVIWGSNICHLFQTIGTTKSYLLCPVKSLTRYICYT